MAGIPSEVSPAMLTCLLFCLHRCRRGAACRAGPASLAGEDAPVSVMGCGTSKVLPEPPKDVQLDLVKKVEPFSGTKSDVCKHFITEVDSVGPLKAGLLAASQCANSCPGAPTTGHTEPPSEPPRKARVAKYRAKFDPRVTAKYDIKALIGRGSFSRVVRVEQRATRQPYAIKMIETKYREGREVCESELRVLRRVRHANIIQLVEVFETQERVYMVMELATGGELFDRIIAKGSFTERDATRVLQMVLDGVRYLHALGITHRDLKPENLLYYHPGTDSKIIITDFGLASARKKGDDCLMKTTCGTPEYIAPEVLVRKPYTNSVDMWALGVIAYILLSGTMPFEDDNRTRLYRQILRGKYSYSGEVSLPCPKDVGRPTGWGSALQPSVRETAPMAVLVGPGRRSKNDEVRLVGCLSLMSSETRTWEQIISLECDSNKHK